MIPPKVTIVILTWNNKDDTIECLDSLSSLTYANFDIVLVDNGSTDGSVACINARFPDLVIIANEKNLGFAEGNNVGITYALTKGVEYVLILNNDTLVEPGFLQALIEVAESDPRIGIVGPKIAHHNNPAKIWSTGGRVSLFRGLSTNSHENCRGIKIVDYVSGCALLIKTETIKRVGLFDKDYFLYYEDSDLNFRAQLQGYLSIVNCDTTILHKTGASLIVRDPIYYYVPRNRLLFMKKHGRWYHYLTFVPSFLARYGATFMWNFARGNRVRCRYMLTGIRDYIKGNYGIQP
jgi:GT2 family glycosyltransferase